MRKAIRLIVLIPLAIILVALALANRSNVLLSLDPIRPDTPSASITVPLFVALLGALIVGIVIGGVTAWFGQGKWRRAARAHARQLEEMRNEQRLRTLPPTPTGGALVSMPPAERRRAV
jgi:uncharacterized integral membrane protein